MVELNFYVSEKDFDRLMDLKEAEGKNDLTGNEYARELLEQAIRTRQKDTKD